MLPASEKPQKKPPQRVNVEARQDFKVHTREYLADERASEDRMPPPFRSRRKNAFKP